MHWRSPNTAENWREYVKTSGSCISFCLRSEQIATSGGRFFPLTGLPEYFAWVWVLVYYLGSSHLGDVLRAVEDNDTPNLTCSSPVSVLCCGGVDILLQPLTVGSRSCSVSVVPADPQSRRGPFWAQLQPVSDPWLWQVDPEDPSGLSQAVVSKVTLLAGKQQHLPSCTSARKLLINPFGS